MGVTVAVKKTQTSNEATVDATATAHLGLAKSKKEAEREANEAARSHFGKGYTLQTEMELFADAIWRLKHGQ